MNFISGMAVLAGDQVLPGLRTILNPNAMGSLLRRQCETADIRLIDCRATYVRYKPSTNCIVAFCVTSENKAGERRSSQVYAKCYTRTDFDAAAEKARGIEENRDELLSRPMVLSAGCMVVYPITEDTVVCGLSTVFNARKLVRIIYQALPEYPAERWRISDKRIRILTVRYKPEKRALFRIDTRAVDNSSGERKNICVFVRAYADYRTAEIAALMRKLDHATAESGKFTVPEAVYFNEENQLLLMRESKGTPLTEALSFANPFPAFEATGQALASFHCSPVTGLNSKSATDILTETGASAESIATLHPRLTQRITRLLDRLEDLRGSAQATQGVVHGDFHHGQCLVADNGDLPVLLDFDRTYRGEVIADLGNFLANLHYLHVLHKPINVLKLQEAFLGSYEKEMGQSIDRDRLHLWTGLCLFQLVVSPFRSLRPHWPIEMENLVERCEQLLP
jgi:hypothetical protein